MEILLQVGLLVIGFAMLIKGADWFVEGAAGIAACYRFDYCCYGNECS